MAEAATHAKLQQQQPSKTFIEGDAERFAKWFAFSSAVPRILWFVFSAFFCFSLSFGNDTNFWIMVGSLFTKLPNQRRYERKTSLFLFFSLSIPPHFSSLLHFVSSLKHPFLVAVKFSGFLRKERTVFTTHTVFFFGRFVFVVFIVVAEEAGGGGRCCCLCDIWIRFCAGIFLMQFFVLNAEPSQRSKRVATFFCTASTHVFFFLKARLHLNGWIQFFLVFTST